MVPNDNTLNIYHPKPKAFLKWWPQASQDRGLALTTPYKYPHWSTIGKHVRESFSQS